MEERLSVQQEWATKLPLQQQSVLLLATRGPDGVGKYHPCKPVVAAYRACVLNAAKYGQALQWGEAADSFMSLRVFAHDDGWKAAVTDWFAIADALPVHYLLHFYHGAEIIGYKHPDGRFCDRWLGFYMKACESMHINPETEEQMDRRLSDWDRAHWT